MGMLVLTRMVDERIFIGDDIIITVISVRGDQVRLGISAPQGVRVNREEIHWKIKDEEDRRYWAGGAGDDRSDS